jgi:hypothetical protein
MFAAKVRGASLEKPLALPQTLKKAGKASQAETL